MLVLKTEIWPRGNASKAFEIARIGIANVTPGEPVADYVMTAIVSRDTHEEVVRAEINKHQRDLGWQPLVRRGVTALFLEDRVAYAAPYDDPVAELLRKG